MPTVDFIQRGTKTRIPVHSGSLGEYFLDQLQQFEDRVALVQQVDGVEVSVTYSELLRHGKVVAGLLRQHGLGSGDTVMLFCGNTLDFAPIMMGTIFVGAALGPIHPGYAASDMLHSLNSLKPQIVISNAEAASSVQEALTQYNTPVVFIPMEAVNKCIAESPDVEDFFLGKVDDPDSHVAFVMSSSGTSGNPKGVELTHTDNLHRIHLPVYRNMEVTTGQQEVYLNTSGPFWVSGQMMTLRNLHRGMKTVLLTPFTTETYLQAIQTHGIHHILINPFQIIALANFKSFEKYDISSLCSLVYAGARVSNEILLRAEKHLPRKISVWYGMTESVGAILRDFQDDGGEIGHIGKPMYSDSEVKISDIETGYPLGPNKFGEIRTKCITTFKGYRGNPKATEESYDEDGFLRSGDLGYYDEDGYFYIVDRFKDTFQYNGIFVNSKDIEEVVQQHPAVSEVAVVGIYNVNDCAHATACVVLHPGAKVTAQELMKLVQGKLPMYKWLHGGVHFMESFPRSVNGKIQKHKLRMRYENPKEISQQ